MKRLVRHRPSPAMVIACLALGIALTGTSVAAVTALAPNSVGTPQIKANAVTAAKLRNANVTGAKIARNAVTGTKVLNGSLTANRFAAARREHPSATAIMTRSRRSSEYDRRPMRSDVSFTLFLSDPESYDGGELVIESAAGEETFKLAPGSLVAYPSTSLHRVAGIARGARFAAVGWARSFIRDAAQRELLFDLDTARRALFARDGKSAEFDLIAKSFANLMRMWTQD